MKKQRKQKDRNQIFCVLTNIFLLFLLGIYPLFQTGSYRTLLQAKTGFLYLLLMFCCGVFVVAGVCQMAHQGVNKDWTKSIRKWSVTDYAVLGFLLTSLLSWLVNDHKKELFWGGYGRNVGLLVIVACGVIYFICSRFGDMKQSTLLVALFTMAMVAMVAVSNHLGKDVLNLYEDLDDRATMLSTLGNLTVLTSYLALILPIAMGLFLVSQEVPSQRVYGTISFVGFLGMFAAGTDSAYLIITILFVVALGLSKEKCCGWKWCVLLGEMLGSVLLLRVLRALAGDNNMKLESELTSFVLKDSAIWLVLVLLVIVLLLIFYLDKYAEKWILIRKWMLVSCGVGVVVLLISIVVLNFGMDEENAKNAFGGLGGYLYFDEMWGTKRIQIWGLGFTVFSRMSLWEKCIGCGPSGFFFALQEYLVSADQSNLSVSGILVDAHSMYLQLLICQGIIGLGFYILAFTCGLCKCKFTCEQNVRVVIYILWLTSFLIQGMVNNIHIYIEPISFALLGVWMRYLHSE